MMETNNMETIKIIIDNNTLSEYEKYYFILCSPQFLFLDYLYLQNIQVIMI